MRLGNHNPDDLNNKSITPANDDIGKDSYMLTIDELHSFPGFEDVEGDEAEEIIQTLYQLSLIAYETIYND